MDANVDRASLEIVEEEFKKFQKNALQVINKINHSSEQVLRKINEEISQQIEKKEELEHQLKSLAEEVSVFSNTLFKQEKDLEQLQQQKAHIDYQVSVIEAKLSSYYRERQQLQSELTVGNEDSSVVLSQVHAIDIQISNLNYEKDRYVEKENLTCMDMDKMNLQIEKSKGKLDEKKVNLENMRLVLSKQKDKLKKLGDSQTEVQNDIENLKNTLREFNQRVLITSEDNVSKIEQCIQCIEQYLNINL